MGNKGYINDLDRLTLDIYRTIKKLTEINKLFMEILEEMAEDNNLVKCKTCGYYEYENLVDCRKYSEEICEDCKERGYGE